MWRKEISKAARYKIKTFSNYGNHWKNAVEFDMPIHFRVHAVVHIEQTGPFSQTSKETAQRSSPRLDPQIGAEAELGYEVDRILSQ